MGGALSTPPTAAAAASADATVAPGSAHMNKGTSPNVCMRCRTVREACSCPDKNIVHDPVRNTKICKNCSSVPEKCECADRVGQLETSVRASIPVRARLDRMMEFLHTIQEEIADEEDAKEIAKIFSGGSALLRMYECIEENRNKGVLTKGLIEKYYEAVDDWFQRCDRLNEQIFHRAYLFEKNGGGASGQASRSQGPEIKLIKSAPSTSKEECQE